MVEEGWGCVLERVCARAECGWGGRVREGGRGVGQLQRDE